MVWSCLPGCCISSSFNNTPWESNAVIWHTDIYIYIYISPPPLVHDAGFQIINTCGYFDVSWCAKHLRRHAGAADRLVQHPDTFFFFFFSMEPHGCSETFTMWFGRNERKKTFLGKVSLHWDLEDIFRCGDGFSKAFPSPSSHEPHGIIMVLKFGCRLTGQGSRLVYLHSCHHGDISLDFQNQIMVLW